jgi:hypothetical protein
MIFARKWNWVVLGAGLALLSGKAAFSAASSDAAPVAPADESKFSCGGKGQPMCPMQKWMKENMLPAQNNSDMAALKKGLEYIAGHAPAGFSDWSKIAKDGIAAAAANDMGKVKASCNDCHKAYKSKYKSDLRDKPF